YIDLLIIYLTTHKNSDECKDRKYLHEINLAEQEWNLLKYLIQVFRLFAEATQYLGSIYYSTYSFIYHVIEKLKEMFKLTIVEIDELDNEDEEDVFDYEEEDQTKCEDSENNNKINNCTTNDNLLYTPCLLKSLEKDDFQVANEIEEYFIILKISLQKDPLIW
ncbi:9917_t:CDS:2, partial [Scutellospora calospora]